MLRPPWRLATVFLACWAVALLTHASGLFKPMHADYSTWVRVARDWESGRRLYEETYDNKQPTLYLFVRLIDSPHPAASLYVAETLLAAVAGTLLFAALWRTLPRCAVIAPLLLIAWSGTSITFVNGQTTEALALWCDVIALSCCVLAASWRKLPASAIGTDAGSVRHGRPFAERTATLLPAFTAGTFFFLMGSFRVPCFLHGIAYLPVLVAVWRKRGRLTALRMLLAFLAGFAVPPALLAAHASAEGYLHPFLEVTRRNLQYGALDRIPFSASLIESAKVLVRMAADQSLAVFLAVVWIVAFRSAKGRRFARRQTTWRRVVLLWLAAAYLSTFPGGRHYHHYYHVLWGPLAVSAALGLARIWTMCRSRRSGRLLAGCAVAVTLLIAVAVNGYAFGKWTAGRRNPTDLSLAGNVVAAAVDQVDALADPQTPTAVYVWGDHSELYWRIDRPPVLYSVPHVLPDEQLNEWAAAVLDQKRVIVVVDQSFFDRSAGDGAFARLKLRLERSAAIRIGPPGNAISVYELRGGSSMND